MGGNEAHYPKPLMSVSLIDLGQVVCYQKLPYFLGCTTIIEKVGFPIQSLAAIRYAVPVPATNRNMVCVFDPILIDDASTLSLGNGSSAREKRFYGKRKKEKVTSAKN